jgi:hypothetical protein
VRYLTLPATAGFCSEKPTSFASIFAGNTPMSSSIRWTIRAALAQDHLLRIYRAEIENGWSTGYVVGIGPVFFALQLVDNACRFDGYLCLRYADVTGCETDPHADFITKALAARGLTRSDAPAIDLSSLETLLHSAGAAFPLVTIHIEDVDEEVCYIGRVAKVTAKQLILHEVDPDGSWETSPSHYNLGDVTRVDFGGAYEEALWLIAALRAP